MNVSGTWVGEYLFEETAGDKEAVAVAGHIVAFTMDLTQGWLGAVSGKVQDDARTGYPEEGKVKGKIKGTMLEFRRLMPVFRMMHETGRITLEKWSERRKVLIDSDRAAPPMLFEGELKAAEGAGGAVRRHLKGRGGYRGRPSMCRGVIRSSRFRRWVERGT